jgi:hypothetical protein
VFRSPRCQILASFGLVHTVGGGILTVSLAVQHSSRAPRDIISAQLALASFGLVHKILGGGALTGFSSCNDVPVVTHRDVPPQHCIALASF